MATLSRRRAGSMAGGMGAATLLAAVGCGAPQQAQTPQSSTKPVTLTWAVRGGGQPDPRQKLLDEYRQLRPNVTVEQVDASGGIAPSIEKIAASMAAGIAVDVINGHLAARQLIESIDALDAIDDLVKRDKLDLSRYNQGALEATGRYEGKLYTLTYAWGGDVAAAVYNKGLFRAAGIKEPSADWSKPWTWDEFRDAMRRLTKQDGSQVGMTGFGFWVHTPLLAWGARWLSNDYKTVTVDSQPTLDAYSKFNDLLFKDRVISDSPGMSLGKDPFQNGKAGISMPCCAALNFARSTRGLNLEWGFVTMPKGSQSSLDVSPVIMGIAKTSKARNEAWDLVKFFDDKSRLAGLEDRMPGVLPDMSPWVKQNFAEWPQSNAEMLVEGMKAAKPLEPLRYHPQWQKIAQEVIDPAWKDVTDQKTSLLDAVKAAKSRIQNIVDDHARSRAGKK
jgi:ABC-type glycerol-3-phosphate transport system substrate-binding protein